MNNLSGFANVCFKVHSRAFENWKEGVPVKTWQDEEGSICIKYTSGNWWHYKIQDNKVIWW